jgi:hypothetical protein
VRYRRFVPDLHRAFAGCDVAAVHGGLTRAMELVAIAVRSSTCCITTSSITSTFTTGCGSCGAGPRVDYPETVALEHLVAIITGEFCRPVAFLPVAADGAASAAASLASLL